MDSFEMDLTVVTVCRNALDLLRLTLESVLEQKSKSSLKIEHLVVDGASTDGSSAWLSEMMSDGKIEAYVSEPDAGIYDAMNKGIRLAKGRVLYFLNAGDVLTGFPLSECVEPLLCGDYATAVAPVVMQSDEGEEIERPSYAHVYLGTPVCHQGFFATAALYRELGGYDTKHFRCLADADFMNRAYAASGEPYVSKNPVAVYASGGFSDNCGYRYLPEYLYMRNRFWDKVLQRSAEDVLYAELITFALIDHSAAMVRWVKEFGLDSGTDILLRHVRDQLRTTRSWKQKAMLWWVGKHSLEPLLTGKAPSERVSKILKWLCIAGSLQKHSPYIHPQYYPHRSLGAAIKALLRNRLCS